jgi:hypothetical protein
MKVMVTDSYVEVNDLSSPFLRSAGSSGQERLWRIALHTPAFSMKSTRWPYRAKVDIVS